MKVKYFIIVAAVMMMITACVVTKKTSDKSTATFVSDKLTDRYKSDSVSVKETVTPSKLKIEGDSSELSLTITSTNGKINAVSASSSGMRSSVTASVDSDGKLIVKGNCKELERTVYNLTREFFKSQKIKLVRVIREKQIITISKETLIKTRPWWVTPLLWLVVIQFAAIAGFFIYRKIKPYFS